MKVKQRVDFAGSRMKMPSINVNVNYLEHVSGRSVGETDYHSHASWQAEFCIKGTVTCLVNNREIPVTRSNILVIPPGTFHCFRYEGPDNEYYSVKFFCDVESWIPGPMLFEDPKTVLPLRTYLFGILGNFDDDSIVAIHMQNILRTLLETDFAESTELKEKTLADQITDILERYPSPFPSATEIADMLNISRPYLSRRIKEETGISLKPFIDIQRANTAKTLLQLSDLSISEIAFQLSFPDVFSFSKFFKRILFVSPSQYRKQYQMAKG